MSQRTLPLAAAALLLAAGCDTRDPRGFENPKPAAAPTATAQPQAASTPAAAPEPVAGPVAEKRPEPPPSRRASSRETKCTMSFFLKGWSAFYKTSSGGGTITCDNGQKASVSIETRGGGFTFGKSQVNGNGTFSSVSDISELFGSYGTSGAEAGAGKSKQAWAMTKGSVSLALTGHGKGVNLGYSFGNFKISRR